MPSVKLRDVQVRIAGLERPVIDVPQLSIDAGERVAITGPSGAGKTTLINVLVGLERPNTGKVIWDKIDIFDLNEADRDGWRAKNVGIVFQEFHLFPGLGVLDNVLLPQQLRSFRSSAEHRMRAIDLLRHVGLTRLDQDAATLSRGEMQRVAIARALCTRPSVVVADEPTASLDKNSADAVTELLVDLSGSLGATLIVITHDSSLERAMTRAIFMDRGFVMTSEGNV
ncbi:ABC transporter ATP-binding protein [Microvirga rosea]|uniref:ABC transporter ATP-binding protein n=1 Tax=Microvirga rosea TaxID=2715425 RepID=UPI001D0B1695|nr:ABC transporter ATP-binding protein [Microvirga rosea]MCB8822156.1 ABC transporter ATP-binding protein [Microvirga rosea]